MATARALPLRRCSAAASRREPRDVSAGDRHFVAQVEQLLGGRQANARRAADDDSALLRHDSFLS
jgi:hypothetical protein